MGILGCGRQVGRCAHVDDSFVVASAEAFNVSGHTETQLHERVSAHCAARYSVCKLCGNMWSGFWSNVWSSMWCNVLCNVQYSLTQSVVQHVVQCGPECGPVVWRVGQCVACCSGDPETV